MESFLNHVQAYLDATAPELRPLFDTMAGEARFARDWLADDLARLPRGAAILEVGGGVFLLTCQLAREGFAVTAIEPTGDGFGAFQRLGAVVLQQARVMGAVPTIAECKAEDFSAAAPFDYAFSLNVMEHIEQPAAAMARVSAVLKPGACYRFLCPNYLFPYEPHFNIPTFGNKRLTERLMRRAIFDTTRVDDPAGLWKSLNWITVLDVRRDVAADASLRLTFERKTLVWMLERAVRDAGFAARRAGWMIAIIRLLVALKLHRLAGLIPAVLQPIMDVRLEKRA